MILLSAMLSQQVSNDNEPPSYQEATAGKTTVQLRRYAVCSTYWSTNCKIGYIFLTDIISGAVRLAQPSPISLLSLGYEEMEAQFAWDDKNIRRTFIRKVPRTVLIKWIPPAQQRPFCGSDAVCVPPAGLRHSHASALCDGRDCLSLHLLVTAAAFLSQSFWFGHFGFKGCTTEAVSFLLLVVHLWGFIFRLIPVCTWHLSKWKRISIHLAFVVLFFYTLC